MQNYSLLSKQPFLRSTIWFWLLLILAAGTAASAQKDGTPVKVHTVSVEKKEIPSLTVMTGTVQAAEQAAIAAKVSGTITTLPVQLGTRVKKGDLLARIHAEELSARLHQAEATLAHTRRIMQREQSLLQKQATTPDSAKTSAEQFAIARAGYDEARTMAGYTSITAPFDGVVARKFLNIGDLTTPGTVLLHLENDQSLQIEVVVPERILQTVHNGDELTVLVETIHFSTRGTVIEIAPAVDPRSRSAVIKLAVPSNPALRSGQLSRVFIPGSGKYGLFVPQNALLHFGQMETVFTVADGKARLRIVRSGIKDGDMVEILAGLAQGETVVTTNNRQLVDGQIVQVLP
ncbi:MAG: efflux RND transporter periplasmic adaptor subunit [Desulfobulbus sp.]|nr:efflux RND transporter periplasmic adaptor subunit [Desulfobulbus sp.]